MNHRARLLIVTLIALAGGCSEATPPPAPADTSAPAPASPAKGKGAAPSTGPEGIVP